MNDHVIEHLKSLYGLNPNMPHVAFQFPRLPPGRANPMFGAYQDPAKERLVRDAKSAGKRLHEFQEMYQRHAGDLFAANHRIIPPNHPLYRPEDNIGAIKAENEKLRKENTELRKKLDMQTLD